MIKYLKVLMIFMWKQNIIMNSRKYNHTHEVDIASTYKT